MSISKVSWLGIGLLIILVAVGTYQRGAVVVTEITKELRPLPEVRSQLYIPWGSNWQVRQRGETLMYEIKVEAENLDAAQLKVLRQRVVENVCAQPAIVEGLKGGAVLEHEYFNRLSGKWLASFVVRAGDSPDETWGRGLRWHAFSVG